MVFFTISNIKIAGELQKISGKWYCKIDTLLPPQATVKYYDLYREITSKIMSYDNFKMHTFHNLLFNVDQYTNEELQKIVIEYADKFDKEYDNFKNELIHSKIITESTSENEIDDVIKERMYPKHLNVEDYK